MLLICGDISFLCSKNNKNQKIRALKELKTVDEELKKKKAAEKTAETPAEKPIEKTEDKA